MKCFNISCYGTVNARAAKCLSGEQEPAQVDINLNLFLLETSTNLSVRNR